MKDVIPETSGSVVWGNDASTIFYEKLDASHRPYQLWRHTMGTAPSEDVLLFTEDDERLWMGVGKSDSGRFLFLTLSGKQENETWCMDLEGAVGAEGHAARQLVLVEKRAKDVRYSVEHHGQHFYIITNRFKGKECLNSMLVRAPVATPGAAHWEEVFPYNPAEQLKYLSCFASAIVLHGRAEGYAQFWLYQPPSDSKVGGGGKKSAHRKTRVTHSEAVYCVYSSSNMTYDRGLFRYEYSSLVTPRQTIDLDLKSGVKTVLKQVEVPHYDPAQVNAFAVVRSFPINLTIEYRLYPQSSLLSVCLRAARGHVQARRLQDPAVGGVQEEHPAGRLQQGAGCHARVPLWLRYGKHP